MACSADSCANARLIPPFFTGVSSITGGAVVLQYSSPYLLIPCGLGLLSTAYFFYLAFDYRNLKTLEMSNLKLESEIDRLKGAVDDYVTQMAQLKDALHQQLRALNDEVIDLKKIKEGYEDNQRKLDAGVGKLQSLLSELSSKDIESIKTSTESLGSLVDNLRSIINVDALRDNIKELRGAQSEAVRQLEITRAHQQEQTEKLGLEVSRLTEEINRLQTIKNTAKLGKENLGSPRKR